MKIQHKRFTYLIRSPGVAEGAALQPLYRYTATENVEKRTPLAVEEKRRPVPPLNALYQYSPNEKRTAPAVEEKRKAVPPLNALYQYSPNEKRSSPLAPLYSYKAAEVEEKRGPALAPLYSYSAEKQTVE